jgi:hypothetical protein
VPPSPIYSNYILKVNTVTVTASSSAVASARPAGPGERPRPATALRIQRSSKAQTLRFESGVDPRGIVTTDVARPAG